MLNISKDISIGDDVLFKMKKTEIIQSILMNYYQANVNFKVYLNTYTTKSDEHLENQILFLYDQMIKQNLNASFIDSYFDNYLTVNHFKLIFTDIEEQINIYKDLLINIKGQLSLLPIESESGQDTIDSFINIINSFQSLKDLDDYVSFANDFKPFKVINKTSRPDREIIKPLLDELKQIFEKIFMFSIYTKDQIIDLANLTKPHAKLLLEITHKFNLKI